MVAAGEDEGVASGNNAGNQMMMKMHYLSEAALNAARLSPSQVQAKLKAGWRWYRLVPGFASAGGTGSYSRGLVSQDGDVAYVSDRADGPAGDESLPALEIEHTMVQLSVDFADKDEAKRLGAKWIGHKRTWACRPDQAGMFERWTVGVPVVFDVLQA